ncbi:MAG: J domain-containing protein, partial [Planctomycetes bacterium]|nr:J domain-containing protein [Planctomycetota bacterium]
MNHDYYAILGVAETADLAALRVAFVRRARECHPDHGGSHAQMVLLNEAWEVLSHPESRRHYDAARSGAADATAAAAFEQEVAAARRKAADYPAEWASFELWLESVAREFTETRYGTSWIDFDNVQGRSVVLFICTGGALGFIVGVLTAMNVEYPKNGRQALLLLGAAVAIPTFLGMLLGKLLHYLIAFGLQLGGIGNSDPTCRISEAERWRMGACAGGAALGLLLIADRSEFQFSYNVPKAQDIAAWTDACLAKLWYGAIRGGVVGAVFSYFLAKLEAQRARATLPSGKLPENFVMQAALY